MNSQIHFDENLSEDLLDENVSVSSINISDGLNKNMEHNPFSRKLRTKQLSGLPINNLKLLSTNQCFKQANSSTKILMNERETSWPSKSFGPQECRRPSKLQAEIKDLLHQSIRLRSSTKSIPCRSSISSQEAVVTMNDVFSAE